jgi:hypothetical protein
MVARGFVTHQANKADFGYEAFTISVLDIETLTNYQA